MKIRRINSTASLALLVVIAVLCTPPEPSAGAK